MKEQSTKGTVIVCDLDNCLSDDGWRRGFINELLPIEERYEAYHDVAHEDEPNKQLCEFLHFWLSFAGNKLIFVTARPERIRLETRRWLDGLGLHNASLFMRKDDEHATSPQLKAKILQELLVIKEIGSNSDIATIIDDRRDVLETLSSLMGVPTFHFAISGFAQTQQQLEIGRKFWEWKRTGKDRNWRGFHMCAFLARHGLINLPDSILAKMTLAPEANLAEAEKRNSPEVRKPFDRVSIPQLEKLYNTSASSTDSIGERVAKLLEGGAGTFRERNATYGSNFRMVGPIMEILFPAGVPPEVLRHDAFHLFELIVVKLSRFAISNFTHQDSIHDATVYAAMIEAIVQEIQENASE